MENKENNISENDMRVKDTVSLLSQTMKDVSERKITLRQALAITRVASALMKAIEVADLSNRVEFLEQVLKRRK